MLTEQAHSGQTAASSSSPIRSGAGTGLRLGGARADFVAGLGRKVADLRAGSSKVREKPSDIAAREALRRRLQALSSTAKMMKFDAMDRAIAEALGTMDRTDLDAPLEPVDLDSIDHLIEDLPALAWGDSDARASRIAPVAKPVTPSFNALIVGSAQIAEALLDDLPSGQDEGENRISFVCESTPDAQAAFDLARSTEPDLVVLDADLEYATELVEALMDEPLTEATPIVVIGSFLEPGESARYVALGVARTLAKPTSKASLRGACEAALSARPGTAMIARVGAIPAPEHVDLAHGDRSRTRLRGPATEVRLEGRKVVIADDDPAVVWFLADLLNAAGCEVHEAFDGQQALELAYRMGPDLLICDIMMPQIDGFSLCRKLRRDVALRDLPVILLSWKEDLLQRVRELGAGAAGYVRKESDTRAIVARIREALRPRAHIEMRLMDGTNEVRGRMDGLSVRTLLELGCKARPDSRVSVRDASFNYEIEVRNGAPIRATRTSGDGTVLHGSKAWTAMLGASAGRFTVVTSTTAIESELEGSLAEQLAAPITRARAATSSLTGPNAAKVARLILDEHGLEDYLRAMPDVVRSMALRMADGASPRTLLLEGAGDAALIEDLVCDLASRGVVTGIVDEHERDLLGPEIVRLNQLAEVRTKFAPSGAPPVRMLTSDCATDRSAPFCESPEPSKVGSSEGLAVTSSLEDAVLRELANRASESANVGSSEVEASPVALGSALVSTAPPACTEDATPPNQILALCDATVIDGTSYGEGEPSIPIEEASLSLALGDSRATKTPLTAVSSQHPMAGVPKRKAWPALAFLAASGAVTWAAVHFSLAPPKAAPVETAAPPAANVALPTTEGILYTSTTPGAALPEGHGGLNVLAPGDSVVLVDGTDRGRGVTNLTLPIGVHEVRLGSGAARSVDIRAAKIAHVKF